MWSEAWPSSEGRFCAYRCPGMGVRWYCPPWLQCDPVGWGRLEKARDTFQSSRAGEGQATDAPPWGGAQSAGSCPWYQCSDCGMIISQRKNQSWEVKSSLVGQVSHRVIVEGSPSSRMKLQGAPLPRARQRQRLTSAPSGGVPSPMVLGRWGTHTCQPYTGHRLNLWESILARGGEFQGGMPRLPQPRRVRR